MVSALADAAVEMIVATPTYSLLIEDCVRATRRDSAVEGDPSHGSSGLLVDTRPESALMSGGFEVLRQHHITLWEVLADMTKTDVPETNWKV